MSLQELQSRIKQLEEENKELQENQLNVSEFTERLMNDAQNQIHELLDKNSSLKSQVQQLQKTNIQNKEIQELLDITVPYFTKMEIYQNYSIIHMLQDIIENQKYTISSLRYLVEEKLDMSLKREQQYYEKIIELLNNYSEHELLEIILEFSNYVPIISDSDNIKKIYIEHMWNNKDIYRKFWIPQYPDILYTFTHCYNVYGFQEIYYICK